MEIGLNLEDGKITSLNKWFYGTYKNDKGEFPYVVHSNWNDWDDWNIEEISWEDETPEEHEEVEKEILEEFNLFFYGA